MNIISKQQAKAQGLKHYFTGKPCKREHVVERLVSSGKCVKCYEEWYATNKESHNEVMRDHYEGNKDAYKLKARSWELDNPDKAKEVDREWHRKQRQEKKQEPKG